MHKEYLYGKEQFKKLTIYDTLCWTMFRMKKYHTIWVPLYFCLFEDLCPTWEFFTHMEMSPLRLKGCNFWPKLGTHGHWEVRVLEHATTTVPWGIRFRLGLSRLGFEPFACEANVLTDCAYTTVWGPLEVNYVTCNYMYMYETYDLIYGVSRPKLLRWALSLLQSITKHK